MPARGLPLLLLMSGAAALVYEIAWSRQLGLLFGHSSHAAAVVLAATFAGMAIGYGVGGRWARRLKQPLRGYGIAEVVVAAWALLTPSMIARLDGGDLGEWLDAEHVTLRTIARAAAAFVVLLPATVALGATLPFVAHHLEARGRAGRETARAYAFNTVGAVLGVLAATFVLIVWLGVRGSGTFAAALSALAGLGALSIADASEEQLVPPPARDASSRLEARFVALAALSGAGTLGLEVLYTRLFALTFHNSTYTFGLVVAVFLLSLAAGGAWVARTLRHEPPRLERLARTFLLAAALVPLSLAVFSLSTRFGYFHVGWNFARYVLAAFGLVAAVIGPPIVLLGTVLPWTWAAASTEAGSAVGRLGAINTLAAAAGALVTSFLLLPFLGLFGSFLLIAALYALAGLVLVGRALGRDRVALGLTFLAAISAGLLLVLLPRSMTPVRKGHELVRRWETPYGWVDVVTRPHDRERRIVQNLHYSFGSRNSTPAMKRLGHLPLLLHPQPERVLFLGLATGLTSSAALDHASVRSIEVAELIPEVIEAARHFADVNGGVVDHPSVRIWPYDARHVLRTAKGAFDVIVSDLFVPWESQAGYLYTVDHYALVRARLAEGGLFCQWLPLWQLGPRELGLIGDSLADVFPHVSMWNAGTLADKPLLALCGSVEATDVSEASIDRRIRALPKPPVGREDLLTTGRAALALYVGDWPRSEGPRNTDDRPLLEFLAPIAQQQRFNLVGHVWTNYLATIAPLKRDAIVARD